MIEIKSNAKHLVALRMGGKLDTKDINTFIEAMDAALARESRLSFYIELSDFGGMTKEALLKDLQYELGLIDKLDRFYRVALVTDEEWVRAVATFGGWVLPKLEIRVFDMQEKSAALAWASEVPPSLPAPIQKPAIRMIATTDPKVLAFEVDGHLAAKDMQPVADTLQAAFDKQKKVRLLNRFKKFDGFDWALVRQEATIRMKLNALRHVERYAVVGGPEWMEGAIKLVNPLFKIEIRHFQADEENEAWAWIGAKPTGSK